MSVPEMLVSFLFCHVLIMDRVHNVLTDVIVVVVDRGADTLIQQAQSWESKGEYLRAIECYARVTPEVTSDANVLQRCWVKVSCMYSLCK